MDEESEIKKNEIFSFNLWILLNILYIAFLLAGFLPYETIENYTGINFLPNKYWLSAIPTHFFVTFIYIFVVVKGIEYLQTQDKPIKEDIFYKRLSNQEMMKEVLYDRIEGIVPDTGDLDEEILKKKFNFNN